jgi:regulator of replication initiation timing
MTTKDMQADLAKFSQQLGELDAQIGNLKRDLQQSMANANCVKGVVQYLQMKLENASGGDNDHELAARGAESVGGSDRAILD